MLMVFPNVGANELKQRLFIYRTAGKEEGRKAHRTIAEQCIIVSGVGLAVEAHGEKGRSAFFLISRMAGGITDITPRV